jgi:hypothetical protein
MKITTKLLIFFTVFLIYSNLASSQGTSVKEWTRKRHNFNGGNYGHPYTIFDRRNG